MRAPARRRPDLVVALSGDVMLARGIDCVLPCPGDPRLVEQHVRDAWTYVRLAESVNGPLDHPVRPEYPWGAVLDLLDDAAPDVHVINLETSITTSSDFAPGKAVHYRMNPANIGCVAAGRPDVCVLANNHVLDLGPTGLRETLDCLDRAGLRRVGAGRDLTQAAEPVPLPVDEGRRVVVHAFAMESSGVPRSWAAGPHRAGVQLLTVRTVGRLAERVGREKQPGDVVLASVHWGSNWGYQVTRDQRRVAHELVEAGVDVVHGHSSHHPRPVEVYQGKLVLYGCGDLVNDYEGIGGYEPFRDDLRLLHLATLDDVGDLVQLRQVPLLARRLRLERAGRDDATWLASVLGPLCEGIRLDVDSEGRLVGHPIDIRHSRSGR